MKTKLLFIALFLGASLFTFAQSLVIMHEGVELEPNEIIQVGGEATAPELLLETLKPMFKDMKCHYMKAILELSAGQDYATLLLLDFRLIQL